MDTLIAIGGAFAAVAVLFRRPRVRDIFGKR